MKKLFLLISMFLFPLYAATGDIDSVIVDEHGYFASVYITGMAVGGTYHTGIDTPYCIPVNPKMILTVTSMGYDSTGSAITRVRTVYGTHFVYDTGTKANLPYETAGDTLKIRIALSEGVYLNDNSGVGKSGTAITYNILSGLYTQGADVSAASTGTVINNSTLVYNKVIGNWSIVPYQQLKGSTSQLKAVFFHIFPDSGQEIACVNFSVTDAHSHTVSKIIGKGSILSGLGDSVPVIEYVANLSMTTLTALDTLLCQFTAYPWIGDADAVMSTGDAVNPWGSPNYCPMTQFCDKSNTYGTTIAVVGDTTGQAHAGTCVDSASFSAAAPPYMYNKLYLAINAIAAYNNTNHSRNDIGGGIVYCRNAADGKKLQYAWAGGTITASTVPKCYLTITTFPGDNPDSVQIASQDGSKTAGDRVHFYNISMPMNDGATSYFFGDNMLYLWLDHIPLFSSNAMTVFHYQLRAYCTQVKFGAVDAGLAPFAPTYNVCFPLIRGCNFTSAIGVYPCVLIGNKTDGDFVISSEFYGNVSNPFSKPMIIAFNKFMNRASPTTILTMFQDSTSDAYGMAFVQNLVETKSGTVQPTMSLAINALTPVNSVIMQYNTVVGGRSNIFYNDMKTAIGPAYREKCSLINNIFDDINIVTSGDDHEGTVDKSGYGNYSLIHGTNLGGNLFAERVGAAGTYVPKFYGVRSYSHGNVVATPIDPVFTDDQSLVGSGGGNGTYTLQVTSPAKSLTDIWGLSYDISGAKRGPGTVGTSLMAAGAYAYSAEDWPLPADIHLLTWEGSVSSDASDADNYSPSIAPTISDTVLLNTGSVNWVLSSVLSIGKLEITSGYTGVVKYNDTLHVNYLGALADSSLFTKPVLVRDSVVYGAASIPIGYAGSRIQSVSGFTLTIKLNGKPNTPRVVNVPGGKIRWR